MQWLKLVAFWRPLVPCRDPEWDACHHPQRQGARWPGCTTGTSLRSHGDLPGGRIPVVEAQTCPTGWVSPQNWALGELPATLPCASEQGWRWGSAPRSKNAYEQQARVGTAHAVSLPELRVHLGKAEPPSLQPTPRVPRG